MAKKTTKPAEPITRDEWLDALDAASRQPSNDPRALTVLELSEKYKIPERDVRRKIHRLVNEGKVVVLKKKVPKLDGYSQLVPAYILKSSL